MLRSSDTSPLIQVLNYSLQHVGGWDCSDCSRWRGERGWEWGWRWQKDNRVRVDILTKQVWEYNLFLAQNVQTHRNTATQRSVNCAEWGKKKKKKTCPIFMTLKIQTVPMVWIDLKWPVLYLMTGWLHIRKHFITAWYSRQVKQWSEGSVCLVHMDIWDSITVKWKWPVPCVPACFECVMFSCVREQIICGACTQTHDRV